MPFSGSAKLHLVIERLNETMQVCRARLNGGINCCSFTSPHSAMNSGDATLQKVIISLYSKL